MDWKDMSVSDLEDYVNDLDNSESVLEPVDRSDLFTDKVKVNNIYRTSINGVECHPFFGRLVNILNDGMYPIICIVGKEGKGKSYSALMILKKLHDMNVLRGDLNIEKQIVYDVISYLDLVRSSSRIGIMFEEADETLNSSDYHSPFNRAVARALRTQRKREIPHIFISPDLKELDPRIRKKMDVLIDMKFKQKADITSYEKKYGKRGNRGLDYKFVNYSQMWDVPDVPKSIQESYEEIDNQFKGKYLDSLLLDLLHQRMEDLQNKKTVKL